MNGFGKLLGVTQLQENAELENADPADLHALRLARG